MLVFLHLQLGMECGYFFFIFLPVLVSINVYNLNV